MLIYQGSSHTIVDLTIINFDIFNKYGYRQRKSAFASLENSLINWKKNLTMHVTFDPKNVNILF